MASLIAWLHYGGARKADGSAVASGTAWFYQPGTTTTQVTVFSDPDGLAAITQPVSLDAGGRAEVYAREACRVDIQDATGAQVEVSDRGNTVTAAQVEIENDAATGTDLTTGAQVEGGRTDLDAYLTSLRSSFGAPDGQVLVGGVPTDLQDVLASVTQVFDVTAAGYGAEGDDTADDTIGIQAAIDDCAAAGGGIVLFPPGTYKLTAPIEPTAGVHLMGVDPAVCALKQHTLNTSTIDTDTGLRVSNLTFTSAHGPGFFYLYPIITNSAVTVVNRVTNCRFLWGQADGSGDGAGFPATIILTGIASLETCEFSNQEVSVGYPGTVQQDHLAIVGCLWRSITISNPMLTAREGATLSAIGCGFRATGAVGFQYVVFNGAANGAGTYHLVGCHFYSTGGSTLQVLPDVGAATTTVTEVGCTLGSNVTIGGSGCVRVSTYRDGTYTRSSGSATTYTPDAALAKFYEVVSTGASFAWATPTNPPTLSTHARELVLRYKNTSGGAITPTLSAGYKYSTVPSVAANSAISWHFVYDNNLTAWVQVGSVVAYAS